MNRNGVNQSRGRLGFITTSFPRFPGDYAGNFVYGMADAFGQTGYDVDVIVPDAPPVTVSDEPFDSPPPPWLRIHRVKYMCSAYRQTLCFGEGAPENLARSPLNAVQILPLVHQMWQKTARLAPKWDGIVSHWLLPSSLIAPRLPEIQLPHLAIAHSGDIHLLRQLPGKQILSAALMRRCRMINFVSRQLQSEFTACLPRHLRQNPPAKLAVTPMGISPNRCFLSKGDARKKLGLTGFTALYVGRLSPIKGVDVLLTALRDCDVQLIVAGAGEMKSQLVQQSQGLNQRVQFVGTVTEPQRDLLLKAADVLVVPSIQLKNGRHEGAPTIIAEAMQAGLPVIATRTGGISEQITNLRNGMLISSANPQSIAHAINIIKENPSISASIARAALSDAATLKWEILIQKFKDMLFK
ncbi:MAG: glycosyltransferase family 4 protein [Deltaproteobacteria bacterium]|nr:glycosyltransferase family 4 protein [Deltaproteobacteria bacterium]